MRRLGAFLVFFGVLSCLLGATHYYLFTRLVEGPQWSDSWAGVGAMVFAGLALLTPVGMIGARMLPRRVASVVAFPAFTWMGVLFVLLVLFGLSEPLRLLLTTSLQHPPLGVARGLAVSVLMTTAVLTLYGVARARGPVPVKRVTIDLARLPAATSGYRLVQLSDVHIGPTLGKDWLAQVVERVNELEADAVVITGDLVDGSVAELADHVRPLADLRARQGVFFVTGNHEYYSGADSWVAFLAELGVTTLRNVRVELGRGDATFDLAGVDDWNAFGDGHGRDLKSALRDRDPERELVLLAHQPRQIFEAAELGVGLQLSGHTHGGQIFPWNYLVYLQQPFVSGLRRVDKTQLYVSNGTGYWGPPIRIGAAPEITLLELRSEV